LIDISEKDGAVTILVRVVPRASRSEITGAVAGALKVRIASPPVEGAANAEVIKLFAKALGVSKSSVEIVSGQSSKSKHIRISGIPAAKVRNLFDENPRPRPQARPDLSEGKSAWYIFNFDQTGGNTTGRECAPRASRSH
jgi:uncharacterized protein